MRTSRNLPAPFAWRRNVRGAWWHGTRLPTPSAYPRLAKCMGAAVLPNTDETLPSMSRGTAIHGYLERCGQGLSPAVALATVPAAWRKDCEAIPLEKLPDLTTGTPELAMGWKPSTGECRILGQGYSRERARQQASADEVPMLADWAALLSPERGILLDYKTGWQEQLAPAAKHLQLLTYGAVYLLAQDLDEVELWLCRPDREEPGWDGPVVMDRLEAEAHLQDIRTRIFAKAEEARLAYRIRGVLPTLHVGPWCAWCPAMRRCPAQVAALLAVLEGDAERAVGHAAELTDAQAGSLWSQLKSAEKLAKELRTRLEGIARHVPLPLPDGNLLYARSEKQEEPKPLEVYAFLRTRYGDEVAKEAVQLGTTWGRLEEVLAERVLPQMKKDHEEKRLGGKPPTKAGLMRDVRRSLVLAGAVDVTWTERVKSRSAKEKPPEEAAASLPAAGGQQ